MEDSPLSPYPCKTRRSKVSLLGWLTSIFRTAPSGPPATSTSVAASRYTPSRPSSSIALLPLPGSRHSAVLPAPPPMPISGAQAQQARTSAHNAPSRSQSYILFGVQGGRPTLAPAQIAIYDWTQDHHVFQALRQCYQAQRGRLRLWFSIWRLECCAIVKVRLYSHRLEALLTSHLSLID